MNSEAILAVLPDSKENAISMNEIALALGLDISSYTALGRTKRQLSRTLRALIKWGWVDCDVRQNENGNKAWYNIYWKTEPTGAIDSADIGSFDHIPTI
jgi:predicted transcriptional regulator